MLAPNLLLSHKQVHLHLRFNSYGLPCHAITPVVTSVGNL